MEKKFKAGDYIVYDTYGICEIKEIKRMKLINGTPLRCYYVLKPMTSGQSTYYVPCDNEELCLKMRKPLNKAEVKELFDASEETDVSWIENRQLRSEKAKEIIKNGITPELVALMRCIYEKRMSLAENGKSLSATDESNFNVCKKLIDEELSFSLNISESEIPDFIRNYIKV